MDCGALAVAVVRHEVVLVQAARSHTSHERTVDVIIFRHFGQRAFLADPARPRTRIPTNDLVCILPTAYAARCPLTGVLELPKTAFTQYAENIKFHQRRVSHVWGNMPFRVSLR